MPHKFKVEVRNHEGEADYALTDTVREMMYDDGWTAYYDIDDDPDDPATFSATTASNDVYDAIIQMFNFRISLYERVPECTMRFARHRDGAFVR